ncbi:MAG: stage II sporulation protein D [Ruminococcus flavefaciens]|nr:stage II sporulation protein D [Ruminococcus flavefaciens]
MKRYFSALILIAVSITVLPAVPVFFSRNADAVTEKNDRAEVSEEKTAPSYIGEPYKVLDVSTGEVIEVDEKTYVVGAVCAEMPATFGAEALKAQAVTAHTYAERQRIKERSDPTPELCGADFSNDTSKYQGYFTKNQAMQYYGENFDVYYDKIDNIVDEVLPYIITYEDEPIISAFHSMSSGKTESAENAWGTAVDYLVPVDSSYDTSAPKYLDEVRYEKEQLRQILCEKFSGITLGEDFTTWISVNSISDSGTVLSAMVGDFKVSGNDIRESLGLRSACFDIAYDGETLIITTKGFGHGVGMSQYGANSMASEGKTWREILEHYYPNCKIEK